MNALPGLPGHVVGQAIRRSRCHNIAGAFLELLENHVQENAMVIPLIIHIAECLT